MDIINLKTENKYRIFTEEVSLVVLLYKGLLVNFNDNWTWKSLIFDVETLDIKKMIKEKVYAFFKLVYRKEKKEWFMLDFVPLDSEKHYLDETKYQKGYFKLVKLPIVGRPIKYNREKWLVTLDNWEQIDVWEMSI